MKLLGLVSTIVAEDSTWARSKLEGRRSGDQEAIVAQCASNMPDYADRCGKNMSPPTCAEDEACLTVDGCHFDCIKKNQCYLYLYNGILPDGKRLCNCDFQPSFDFFWTCDFNHFEHGSATVPPIEKHYSWDDRKITMLDGSRIDQYKDILADESTYFDGFFQASPASCEGKHLVNGRTKKVSFSNIFDDKDCMPKCQLQEEENGSISERCDVVIGYDDLMLSLNGTDSEPALMARGASWELTCYRSLQDTVRDIGTVNDEPPAPFQSDTMIKTKFNLDVACCDPEDRECQDDCSRNPILQISPNAGPKKFFVKMDFEYGNKDLKDRGYLHVESCTLEEIDENGIILNGPLELVHDGCPNKFGRVSIIENMRNRTLDMSYREQMDLLPFKIDSGAETFNLTCDLLACPWYAVNNNLCKLKDSCSESDRYDTLTAYANDNFNTGSNWISRKRRSTDEQMQIFPSKTITKTLKHPCTEVRKEGDMFCIQGDDNCWTYDICKKRRSAISVPNESQVSSATVAVLSVCLLVSLL